MTTTGETTAMSDRETLAELLVEHPALPTYDGHLGRHRCPKCGVEINGSCNSPSHAEHQADAILTSDWLKEHDRQVRKQALPNADTLARTIHAVGPCSDEDCANPDDWGYCDKRAEAILRLLAEVINTTRKQVAEEITEAIESKYLGPDSGRLPDGRDAPDAAQRNAYDEDLEVAARIAHQASREIGGAS